MHADDIAYEVHIQISVLEEETALRLDFEELSQQTNYCLGAKGDNFTFMQLQAQVEDLCRSYRESSQLNEREPLNVAVWFTTPRFEPEVHFEPEKKKHPFTVIQGGKHD